jgi:hypothetical protein
MKIEHGTRRGFQQHKALGSVVCEPCRLANNEYMAKYMRENYDPAKRRAAHAKRIAKWGRA